MNEFDLGGQGGRAEVPGERPNTKGRGDPNKKIFIGGVPRTVADDEYREYFGSFGELDDCILMRDQAGICRGFGFVTYREQAAYDKVMEAQLQLRGRPLEQKKAVPRNETESRPEKSQVKVFIGGLSPEVDKATLDEHFGQYGEIVDSVVMMDSVTGNSRGFGFVTFSDPASVEELMKTPRFELCGKSVQCKRAQPHGQMNRGGGGGRAGGYGGGRYNGEDRYRDSGGWYRGGGGADSRYNGGGARYGGDRYGGGYGSRGIEGGSYDSYDSRGGYGGSYGREPRRFEEPSYRGRIPPRDPWQDRQPEPRPMAPPPRSYDDPYAYSSGGGGGRFRPY